MNLISLIARNPKEVDNVDHMTEAIKLLATSNDDGGEGEKQVTKIDKATLEHYLTK